MAVNDQSKANTELPPAKRYYNDKWFRESVEGISLVGWKCKSCGMVFFPYKSICIRCYGGDVEEFELSKKGKLFTFTIVFIPSKNFRPPYAVGYVELPEGIRIFSQIKDWEKYDLKAEMEMEMIVDTLWENSDGTRIIGYKFKPITS